MFMFMSPGVLTDAGGIVITIVDGKVVIKRVPGWNPEVLAEVTAAVATFAHAGNVENRGVRRELESVAHQVLQARVEELQEYAEAENREYSGAERS